MEDYQENESEIEKDMLLDDIDLDIQQDTVTSEPDGTLKIETATAEKEHAKFFDYSFAHFGVIMIIFAFIGWFAENCIRMVSRHTFDSRHQLLPFLFAYAIAVFAVYLALGTPQKMRIFNKRIFTKDTVANKILSHLTYFLVLSTFVFFGEMVVGTFYESVTGVVLWDYSETPLHVTKYTGLPSALGFGGGMYLIMAFLFKPLMNWISKMSWKSAATLDIVLGSLIVIDFFIMVITVFATGAAPEYWSITW